MNSKELYDLIATAIRRHLGPESFMSMTRSQLTHLFRHIADDPRRRVNGSGMESALNRKGLRTYPSLRDGRCENFRVIRRETLANLIVELAVFPNPTNDKKFRYLIKETEERVEVRLLRRKQTGNHNGPL